MWTFPALTGPHASLLMSRIPAFTSFFSVFEGGSLKLLRAIWAVVVYLSPLACETLASWARELKCNYTKHRHHISTLQLLGASPTIGARTQSAN